jgi:hypothetical protein
VVCVQEVVLRGFPAEQAGGEVLRRCVGEHCLFWAKAVGRPSPGVTSCQG